MKTFKELRQQSGLSQQALADLTGVSRSTIYNIEQHKHIPNVVLVYQLSVHMALDFEKLCNVIISELIECSLQTGEEVKEDENY